MRIAHSKDFQQTFKGNYVFECIQGASILRMLEDWMGKENFRDGCRVSGTALPIYFIPFLLLYLFVGVFFGFFFLSQKYLKDFHFKNAKTANFWESLTNVRWSMPVFIVTYSSFVI